MKHPKPDIGDILRGQFINNVSTVRKLLRYWGTEFVDDVEVLKQRQYYYPAKSRGEYFEKLFRFLGAYDDVTGLKMDGIKYAWIYFNKNKDKNTVFSENPEGNGVVNYEYADFISTNLNRLWWNPDDGLMPADLTLTTTLLIEGRLQDNQIYNPDEYGTGYTLVEVDEYDNLYFNLKDKVRNDYAIIWDTYLVSQQGVGVINKGEFVDPVTDVTTPDNDDLSPDDVWLQTLARYALLSDIPCTIKNAEIGYGTVEYDQMHLSYAITLEIPYTTFTPESSIVQCILTDILEGYYYTDTNTKLSYSNGYYTRQAILGMSSVDLEDDDSLINRPYLLWEDSAVGNYENMWYAGRLRADVLRSPRDYGLTYKEVCNYILPLIDTGYKKKKVPTWKKVVGVVVFIIIVIIAWYTGGATLKFAPIALAIIEGALVFTLLTLALGAAGASEWAAAFSVANKMVSPLVYIAMIYIAWTGIAAYYEASAAEVGTATVGETGAITAGEVGVSAAEVGTATVGEVGVAAVEGVGETTIGEVAAEGIAPSFIDTVIEMGRLYLADLPGNIVVGAIDLAAMNPTPAAINLLTRFVEVVNQVQKFRLEEINDRNKDLQSQYEKMEEEAAQENDLLAGFARISASPAVADASLYSRIYDLPYEGSGGLLHTGNVLRTTKQALRKAKYDDPVFANILII